MAASKDTRRSAPDTNPFFLKLFRKSSASKERKCIWQDAVRHAGTGDPHLRFPVYEHLYLLNVYTEKMVELLEELSCKFAINSESLPYCRAMLHYVRASASHGLIDFMAGVEQTETWLYSVPGRLSAGQGSSSEKAESGQDKMIRSLAESMHFRGSTSQKGRVQNGRQP